MLSPRRMGKITGSSCHILFPKRENKTTQESYAMELAIAKLFNYRQNASSWQMDHGHTREAMAMDIFRNTYPFAYFPEFKSLGEYGGSADCMIPGEDFGVDFKCPTSLEKWLSYLNGVDHQQERQAQMYMWLYEKPKWKIIAFLNETNFMIDSGEAYPVPPGKRFIVCEIHRDPLFEAQIQERGAILLKRRDEIIEELKIKLSI